MKKINEYINIKEAAHVLGVTPNTLRNWEQAEKVQVYRNPKNSYRLYDKEHLESLLQDIRQT